MPEDPTDNAAYASDGAHLLRTKKTGVVHVAVHWNHEMTLCNFAFPVAEPFTGSVDAVTCKGCLHRLVTEDVGFVSNEE